MDCAAFEKNKTRHFYLNYRIPNYAEFNTFSVCWSVTKYPRPQWRYQKKIRLDLHNVHLILRSHEAAFCQIDVASSSRWVAFPSIWAFPFIRITTLSLSFPASLNRCWKRQGKGMTAGRYDCTPTQCYQPDTVLSNIWRKSFRSIFDCLLGCEAAVGRLTTWWAALKYTLRIKLFIQDGDMYPACLKLWRRFCLLQLAGQFLAHPASSHFIFKKKEVFRKSRVLVIASWNIATHSLNGDYHDYFHYKILPYMKHFIIFSLFHRFERVCAHHSALTRKLGSSRVISTTNAATGDQLERV